MVQSGRFAFDEGWHWDPRDWGREWDDLDDEFPPAGELEPVDECDPGSLPPEQVAPRDTPDEDAESPPRRHLSDADWLKPRRRRERRAG